MIHSFPGPVGSVTALAFSADGKWLAAGDSDTAGETPGANAAVMLWETAHWKPTHTLAVDHKRSIGLVAFSPDGKTLATGDNSDAIALWAVPSP
ncbi:MAG TPA: hypothetical protein VKU00_21360 [Chthonomonadaceae bacterium]|nr:hypothetical protein [Chthonomonadaceae bacterium]